MSKGIRVYFSKEYHIICLKIYFTFTNSVDPDGMQHYATFHLGPHCLQKYSFRDPEYKGLKGTRKIKRVSIRNCY